MLSLPRLTLLLGTVLLVATCAHSQMVCEPFENVPQPCQSFLVGNWSWVQTVPRLGYSQEVLHAQMLQAIQKTESTFVSLLDGMTLLEPACGIAYARALCLTFFNPCNPLLAEQPPVCRSVCLNYLQVCGTKALVNLCDEVNPLTGMPIFMDVPGCTTNGDDFLLEPFVYPCPRPTVYREHHPDTYTGLPCNIPCKEQLYAVTTKRKFDDLFITVSVFSWISMFASLIVIAVYLYFPLLRKYPSRLVTFAALGNLVLNIAWVGNSVQNPEEFLCEDDGITLITSGWCQFSAFATYLGGMLLATWWWIQVMVMTYNVGFQQYKERWDKKLEWVLHVWGWGYPLICAFMLTFVPNGHGAGALTTVPWCLSSSRQPAGLSWGLFYGVICGYMLFVIIGLSITVWRVLSMGFKSSMRKKSLFGVFIGIFLFGIWYLTTSASIIAEAAYNQEKISEAVSSSAEGLFCWFTTAGRWQDCPKGFDWNYGLLWWDGVMVSLTGVALFIIFLPLNAKARATITESRNTTASRSSTNS